MSEYDKLNQPAIRKLAADKGKTRGMKTTVIRTMWSRDQCIDFLQNDIVPTPAAPAMEIITMIGTDAEVQYPLEPADDTVLAYDVPAVDGLKMEFSTFNRKTDSTAKPLVILNKKAFIGLLATHHARPNKDGKLFAPATFNGSRTKDNFISASGVCLDFDHGTPEVEKLLELIPGTLAAYYSTFSHGWTSKERKVGLLKIPANTTYTSENPRFRVVIPLSRPVNADEHARLILGVKSILTPELTECLDQTCFERARSHYLPSCLPGHERHAFTGHQDGDPLDVEHFLFLGRDAVQTAIKSVSPAPADVQQLAPAAPRTFEYADPTTGEVFNLSTWAAQNPTFDIVAALDPQYLQGKPKDGKQHIQCPFEDQHTDQGQDLATFISNASPPQYDSWDVHCCHSHCDGRDRLDYILAMLENGWMSVDQLRAAAPAPIELKHPPYMNYRAQEIAAELVKQPLSHEEFRINLHLMHVACAVHDGTLPDNSRTISRILGITEVEWLAHRASLIDYGWQIVEGGRISNPITLREYRAAQSALMKKSSGGKAGGLTTQARRT